MTGTADAAVSSADCILVQRAYDLLSKEGEITVAQVTQARDYCQTVYNDFQAYIQSHQSDASFRERPTGWTTLMQLAQQAYVYLNNSLLHWDGAPTIAANERNAGRVKVETLNDILNP
jgi:hypothetical protein